MKNELKKANVRIKEKIPQINRNSTAEEQLLYNFSIQSELGNVVRFFVKDENDIVVLKVEYDSFDSTYEVEFYIRDKELFYRFFEKI